MNLLTIVLVFIAGFVIGRMTAAAKKEATKEKKKEDIIEGEVKEKE